MSTKRLDAAEGVMSNVKRKLDADVWEISGVQALLMMGMKTTTQTATTSALSWQTFNGTRGCGTATVAQTFVGGQHIAVTQRKWRAGPVSGRGYRVEFEATTVVSGPVTPAEYEEGARRVVATLAKGKTLRAVQAQVEALFA